MRAVVYAGPERVEVRSVPDPRIEAPEDALVRVTLSAICGTDLHAWHGLDGIPAGTPLGHEFVGEVVAVGTAVQHLAPGDRVVGSDFAACGHCWWCRRGDHWECPQRCMFGMGSVFGPPLGGAQAELLRVPFAQTTLQRLPAGCSDEAAIFAGDTLASGVAAAERGGVVPGDVVAVIGGGAVGQMASLACQSYGAAAVVVTDLIPARRQLIAAHGGVPSAPEGARQLVDELTDGRGADVVVEAVGGSGPLETAFDLVRRRGRVVSVGAHFAAHWAMPVARAFADELSVCFAIGDSIRLGPRILPLLTVGAIDPTGVISERVSLDGVPDAYRRLAEHTSVKILIDP
jgi:threonine dehydrogenase-like Zn-dependent dehydrogenase